ncbi:MAG: hypothetical protein HC785_33175, partial [Calothrix sp. CSU_2_0]|nr:hypothetical protein [Calothrix sp. CSU_2_0]
ARPIKRAIQREVENAIATKILENSFVSGDTIVIDSSEQGLSFNKKVASKPAIAISTSPESMVPTTVTLLESASEV